MEQIIDYIFELCENGVFEIWSPDNSNQIFIPYMMNDALECYIVLEDAVKVGEPQNELKAQTQVMVHQEENGRFVLVAKQGDENTYTLFFSRAHLEKKYYRFDGICHFWDKGQEHWGQLVYTIGTMFDKYAFLGEESCNREEKYLLPLIEYAPFRAYAPAKQLFEELYDTTRKGTFRMMCVAIKAHDFLFAIENVPYLLFQNSKLQQWLTKKLRNIKHYALYNYLYEQTMAAASKYSDRVYKEYDLEGSRKQLEKELFAKGYEGSYPDFQKENKYLRVVEERPFTIMDWDDFVLRKRLMISECNGRKKGYHLGYFEGADAKEQVIDVD